MAKKKALPKATRKSPKQASFDFDSTLAKKAPATKVAPKRGKTGPKPEKKPAHKVTQRPAKALDQSQPELLPLDGAKIEKPEAVKKVKTKSGGQKVTAERMGELQRDISISEFFTKNRHLLGFDNASRALLTSVKEAVDNSLDACEEAGILPEIRVRVRQITENRFSMSVEDNGPGIVKAQLPKVFGKLLYGSKFHRLRQSRGQQGIGISAAGMYGQLTTGKPIMVTSKTGVGRPAIHYHIQIDTTQNRPVILHEDTFEWPHKDHGTDVTIEMQATYKGGKRSLDEYLQNVAVANPHVRLEYFPPGKKPVIYPRLTEIMPRETKEIKPHPYGIELGMLQRMAQASKARALSGFLQSEFSRVSAGVVDEIAKISGLDPNLSPKDLDQEKAEQLYKAIGQIKIMAPPTNCLAPIGEPALMEGIRALLVQRHLAASEADESKLRKREGNTALESPEAIAAQEAEVHEALASVATLTPESPEDDNEEDEDNSEPESQTEQIGARNAQAGAVEDEASELETAPVNTGVIDLFGKACFLTAVSRSPRVYRGNPFQVEAALAYGGELPAEELASVVRLANRVPLLHQPGACAMTQAVIRTNWRSYDVEQARGALPTGPLLLLVHIASVWVPFTSEAKEAVAHYDEIITELKFALQECGRRLSRHIRRRRRVMDADKKQRYMEKYIPHIGEALQEILGLNNQSRDKLVEELTGVLERSRKF